MFSKNSSKSDKESHKGRSSWSDRKSKSSKGSKSRQSAKSTREVLDGPDPDPDPGACTTPCLAGKLSPDMPKPRPQPQPPFKWQGMEAHGSYEKDSDDWNEEYQLWENETCQCGKGYWCRAHGQWVSGTEVRAGNIPCQQEESADTCHPFMEVTYGTDQTQRNGSPT